MCLCLKENFIKLSMKSSTSWIKTYFNISEKDKNYFPRITITEEGSQSSPPPLNFDNEVNESMTFKKKNCRRKKSVESVREKL